MLDKKDVLSLFPHDTFREHQVDVIEQVCEMINSDKRIILMECPTGFGKSPVNLALCRAMKSSYYLTPQKILQRQLYQDYKIPLIMGRNNYKCNFFARQRLTDEGKVIDCSEGMCKRRRNWTCSLREAGECDYWKAKVECMNAQTALMNFMYFITEGFTGGGEYSFGDRELVIVDECHFIDNWCLNFNSVTISNRTVPSKIWEKKLIPFDTLELENIDEVMSWLEKNTIRFAEEEKVTLESMEELGIREVKRLNKIDDLLYKWNVLKEDIQKNVWVHQVVRGAFHQSKIVFQPIYVAPFMKDLVWKRGDYFILSSATILNPKVFLREVGLEGALGKGLIGTLKVPHTFPIQNRLIYTSTIVGKMTREYREQNLVPAVDMVKKILNKHPNEKGILHMHSYKNSDDLAELAGEYANRFVFHTEYNREEVLENWENNGSNNVLVSVNMEEGLDLAYELSRFQILFKVGYSYLGDKRVKVRVEAMKERDWYVTQALKKVVQAYGRGVRAPDDYCAFYVIDASFHDVIRNEYVPSWFLEAITDKKLEE